MKKIILLILIVMISRLNGSQAPKNSKQEGSQEKSNFTLVKKSPIFFGTLLAVKIAQGYACNNFSDFKPSLDLLWDKDKKKSSAFQYALSAIIALFVTQSLLLKTSQSQKEIAITAEITVKTLREAEKKLQDLLVATQIKKWREGILNNIETAAQELQEAAKELEKACLAEEAAATALQLVAETALNAATILSAAINGFQLIQITIDTLLETAKITVLAVKALTAETVTAEKAEILILQKLTKQALTALEKVKKAREKTDFEALKAAETLKNNQITFKEIIEIIAKKALPEGTSCNQVFK